MMLVFPNAKTPCYPYATLTTNYQSIFYVIVTHSEVLISRYLVSAIASVMNNSWPLFRRHEAVADDFV